MGVRARELGGEAPLKPPMDGGLQPPPDSGKTIIFRAKATFFGQRPAAKKWKNILFCIY